MIEAARRLSYANSLSGVTQRIGVRAIEWATFSTPRLLWRLRALASGPLPHGADLCHEALAALGIGIRVDGLSRCPQKGPLVIVANHPTGLLDGAALLGGLAMVRPDLRIMARALVAGMPQVAPLLLPVPYDHDPDRRRGLRKLMRDSDAHLRCGGAIALFPAGRIAYGTEPAWSSAALRLARRWNALVLPVHVVSRTPPPRRAPRSPVMRQGLLLHQIAQRMDSPIILTVGTPRPADGLTADALRRIVLDLGMREKTSADGQRVGTGSSPR